MLSTNIIRESTSPYSSPVILAKIQDDTWHMCMYYRKLNKIMGKYKFQIPLIDKLHGARIFSKLDLHFGYYQIRVAPDDVGKMA